MTTSSQPVSDYDTAVARIQMLQAQDADAINPLCRTRLLTHGRKVERAIVFLHGFTNCPQQFGTLAQMCFEAGANVLVPRIQHHGLRDRLTTDLAQLTAAELTAFAADVLDTAHGLGERVSVVGMSLGSTLALWAAQQRPDVARAVAIAPLVAPKNVPRALLPILVSLAERLPNFFVWWDQRYKEKAPGPQHAYPRFASRALAEVLRLAAQIETNALRANAVPQAQAVLLVTNASDPAVDNAAAHAIVQRWRANGAQQVETYEFEASLRLLHDLIDEQQVGQRTEIVYPVLIQLIGEG